MSRNQLKLLVVCALSVLSVTKAFAERIPFAPIVTNWSVQQNHGVKQNWSISQAENGTMFIGNGSGLLEFDGFSWKMHDIPNATCIRSVFCDGDRVYVGSYREFGYYDCRDGEYVSISSTVDPDLILGSDIWNICKAKNGNILFQSFMSLYTYDGSDVMVNNDLALLNIFNVRGRLWGQKMDGGLCLLDDRGEVSHEVLHGKNNGGQIVSVLPYGEDEFLLLSLNKGISVFHRDGTISHFATDFEDKLHSCTFNRACVAGNAYYLGTVSDGILVCSLDGKLICTLDNTNGLQNNTVLGFLHSADNNVWAVLDDGVSLIHANSSIATFNPSNEHFGMVYDVLDHNGQFYAATNQGLFTYQNGKMKRISPEADQVWYVNSFGDFVMTGTNTTTYQVKGSSANRNLQTGVASGAFSSKKAYFKDGNAYLIEGSYSGLNIYEQNGSGDWHFRNRITAVALCKEIEVDNNGCIWVQHERCGIYKVKLNEDLTDLEEIKAFTEIGNERNRIFFLFKINGAICVYNGSEFWNYDEMHDRMEPVESLNEAFASARNVHQVCQTTGKRYWFVADDRVCLASVSGSDVTVLKTVKYGLFGEYSEERSSLEYDADNKVAYLCLDNQIVRIPDDDELRPQSISELSLASFTASNKKGKVQNAAIGDSKLKAGYNSVVFDLHFPNYDSDQYNMHVRLDGLFDQWHECEMQMKHSFYGLAAGKYSFNVEVYDGNTVLSSLAVPFTIRRPWYASILMFVVYAFLFAILVIAVERALKRMTEHLRKLSKVSDEKQSLESELKEKTYELASLAAKNIEIDEDSWQIFKSSFERVDEKFFTSLQAAYPSLTPADLKFCSLLRLNLTTKEIANTLNLTTRGVESARYRLRKKFNLEPSDSLTSFIINFTKHQQQDSE